MDTEKKTQGMEFPENEIQDPKKCKLLKSTQNGDFVYTSFYIFSVAGDGTSRTIAPKVYYLKDTAFLSFEFIGQSGSSFDLANLLKLQFRIYDKHVHNLVFVPPMILDSIKNKYNFD